MAVQIEQTFTGTHGSPAFAFAGDRITLQGVVRPFAAGQSVVVSVRGAGGVVRRRLRIARSGPDAGAFRMRLRVTRSEILTIHVSHNATPSMAGFSAGPVTLRVLAPRMGEGARGQGVWFLQRRLSRLRYAVPLSGVFEAGTANAVIAYRKMLGLPRLPVTSARVIADLERNVGAFRVRFPRDGRHVEANLAKQVLAEVEPHGRVWRIYAISSGKPSTPTVQGRYRVYLKTPGVNSEGMVDSSYFVGGYAIHGYPEVPTWAASHGCLRVPIEDAAAIYAWARIGTPVDIYD